MLRKAGITIAVLFLSVLLGCMLMTVVYCIPHEAIEPQVAGAAEIIAEEGGWPEMSPYATSALDNWTDSIMLMEAAFPTGGSPWENAMMVRRYGGSLYPFDDLTRYYSSGEYESIIEYPNYWHGYLVFLKPLLAVMEYSQIRSLNGAVQTLLVFLMCLTMWRREKKHLILPYLFCIGLLMPVATAKCMQFSSCYYVFHISCLAMLLTHRHTQWRWYLFLLTGAATSYLDFLTYPLACFGMPVLICLFMDEDMRITAALKKLGCCFLAWTLGYSVMWLGKFALGSIITGQNLLLASMDHVYQWTAPRPDASILYAFYFCISNFARSPVMILAVLYVLILGIYLLLAYRKCRESIKTVLLRALPFMLVAILPFVYFAVMLNPTIVHGGLFIHKALIVTAFAATGFLAQEVNRILINRKLPTV